LREIESRKRAHEEAEKQRQIELAEQRQVLERDKKIALLKQQSEFNRERESLQKKLERKTANELGDGGEIDVFEAVRGCFDGTRVRLHEFLKDRPERTFARGVPQGRNLWANHCRCEKSTSVAKDLHNQATARSS